MAGGSDTTDSGNDNYVQPHVDVDEKEVSKLSKTKTKLEDVCREIVHECEQGGRQLCEHGTSLLRTVVQIFVHYV